jgi:chain length determinant protein (polysaccharide antigen chain regulator)
VQGVSVDSVYALFKRNLGALSLQKEFFIGSGERDRLRAKAGAKTTDEQLFTSFSSAFAIETDKKDKDALRFAVRDSNPEKAAQLANDFSAFAERATVQALILDVQTAVKNRIAMIESDIASKRVIAKQRRLDRIAELKEALLIAQRLNLSEQIDAPAQITANTTAGGGISVNTGSTPLFYRGTNALNAELLVLNARESDDPFISGLRDSQEELARLRSVSLDPNVLKVAKTDQAAFAPTAREKPKRKLIVMLGFVLGGMLGVFAAFFVNFVQNQKELESKN